MARDEAGPFARGESFYNGSPIDLTNLGGVNLEGKEFIFEVNAPDATGAQQADPSGRAVRVRCVRNSSGVYLKPGRIAHYKAEYPYGCHIDGYTFAVTDRVAGVVDDILPTSGVAPNDLFYIVTGGPTRVVQNHTSPAAIVIGSVLVPDVDGAASATDDLGGRVALQDVTGTGAALAANISDVIGYADGVSGSVVDGFVPIVVARKNVAL